MVLNIPGYIAKPKIYSGLKLNKFCEFTPVKDIQSGSRVTRNGARLLRSGRKLTTKWGNNLGLSLCAMPRSAVARVVAYFRRTELLPGVSERSGID